MEDFSIHLTVAVVCEKDGRFLMVEELPENDSKNIQLIEKSQKGLTVINQPAGHVEPGESLTDAAIRETLEETAHIFVAESLLGFYQLNTQFNKTYYRVCFIGSATPDPSEPEIDPEILKVHWLNANEILTHPNLRSPLVAQCLHDYMSGNRFPLSALRDQPLLS